MSAEVDSTVDRATRTATIRTTFDHPAEVVWSLWSDPDKLARWWGPPRVPMTVDHHDLRPGGRVEVTARPGGHEVRGSWSIGSVDPPRSLRFTFSSDGLAPTDIEVNIEPANGPGGDPVTTMTLIARFSTEDDLAHALDIGFVDGVTRSVTSASAVL